MKRANSTLFCDNEAAVNLIDHPGNHKKTKHIVVKYLKIREYVKERQIEVNRVPSSENIADLQTKLLYEPTFQKFRAAVGVRDLSSSVKVQLESQKGV